MNNRCVGQILMTLKKLQVALFSWLTPSSGKHKKTLAIFEAGNPIVLCIDSWRSKWDAILNTIDPKGNNIGFTVHRNKLGTHICYFFDAFSFQKQGFRKHTVYFDVIHCFRHWAWVSERTYQKLKRLRTKYVGFPNNTFLNFNLFFY